MTAMPRVWQDLSRDVRDQVLARLMDRRKTRPVVGVPTPLTRAEKGGPSPASLEQQWILDRQKRSDGRLAWAVGAVPITLKRPKVAAVTAALEALQEWYPVLRTRLRRHGAQFSQEDAVDQALPFEVVRVPARAVLSGAKSFVRDRYDALTAQGFNAETGPLWRAELVKRGSSADLLLSFCSLIADEQTADMLRTDFEMLYEGYRTGTDLRDGREDPELGYLDYAVWQKGQIEAGRWTSSLEWWRAQLAGGPPAYWSDARKGSGPSLRFQQVIGVKTGRALDAYARTEETTPEAVMLTEFMALLAELDGGPDVWVTSPVDRRVVPGTEEMAGAFSRQVLLRLYMPEDEDPLPLVQTMLAETRDHDGVPHSLVHQMLTEAYPNAPEPFRYVFDYREAGDLTSRDVEKDVPFKAEPEQIKTEREEDVLFKVRQIGDARQLFWHMRADRFSETRAEEVIRLYLQRLLVRINLS